MNNEVKLLDSWWVILESRADDEGMKWGHVQVSEFTEGSLKVNGVI